MFTHIIRFLRGTVYIKIIDSYPERFLYLCQRKNIPILTIERHNNSLTISLPYSKYKKAIDICSTSHIEYTALKFVGIPHIFSLYKHRIGLIIGLFSVVIAPYILSLFVLNINIVGNENIPSSIIYNELKELGVYKGAYRKHIDTQTVERMLIVGNENISWSAVNILGCTAEIKIREVKKSSEILDTTTPANIVAKKDGYIISTEVYEGQALVKAGDSVLKGQILISGITEDSNSLNRLVKARGRIIAEIDEEKEFIIPKVKKEYSYKGLQKRTAIMINSKPILSFNKIECDNFKEISSAKKIKILGYETPIEIQKSIFLSREPITYPIDFDRARAEAYKKIKNYEDSIKNNKKIAQRDIVAVETKDSFIFTVNYKLHEDIAKGIEILCESPN